MKRMLARIATLILLAGLLVMTVSAQSTASKIDTFCTVNADGDCLVNMSVTLNLETASDNLTFPLPLNAENVLLNKSAARTAKGQKSLQVDIGRITGGGVGTFTMQFDYMVPGTVYVDQEHQEDETLESGEKTGRKTQPLVLDLPLLSGFSFPVESLNFTVYLPGTITTAPRFYSVYHQNSVESMLNVVVDGTMITGSSTSVLNDHEGVNLEMNVTHEMFPNIQIYEREGNPEVYPMIGFAVLALLYWLVFLRCAPLIRYKTVSAPEGIAAGELGCRLTLAGGDLTMMVMSWAQLGYLLIQVDQRKDRVILHKRMDMGNERSLFEIRIFNTLFSSRNSVDATGYSYAKLVRKVAKMVPGEKTMCKTASGNMKLFRAFACLVQVFCGICVAMNMTHIRALQIILAIIFGVFGAVSAWQIQEIAYRTHLRGKLPVFIGLGLMVVWILLGILCGQWIIPLVSTLGQFLFSYLAAYGGRRSDLNRHDVGQILGLRHYLKRLPREDVDHVIKQEPDYFFEMAPYALAMGIMKPFARNFGRRKWEMCPYMITGIQTHLTAGEWAAILRRTTDRMDQLAHRMDLERWMPIKFR